MIACLDVCYADTMAHAAVVVFRDWADELATEEKVIRVENVQPYEPGEFFRRELPCLLAALEAVPEAGIVIIDGYVWLDGAGKPGLGAHLHEALGGRATVIGVAKTKFRNAEGALQVLRGESQKPLFVTAAGMSPEQAAEHVRAMHGDFRIPTLLKRADYLCRYLRPEAIPGASHEE